MSHVVLLLWQVARIKDLLVSVFALEVERIESMDRLVESLEELIAAKQVEMTNDREIANEMIDIQSKQKDGAIAANMDKLIDQKLSAADIEQELVDDMFECRAYLQNKIEEAQYRVSYTKQALEGLAQDRPDARSSRPYDWTNIEDMELILQQAADNLDGVEERIRELSRRISIALVNRAVILGEDVPRGLEKGAQRSIRKFLSSPDVDFDFERLMNLKDSDKTELFSRLADSVSSPGGLKTFLDSATGKSDATKRPTRFGQDTADAVRKDRLTLEDRIAASIAEAKALGVPRRMYETTRKELRDSTSKTQRMMNRSEDEKERAADIVANIKDKRQPEIRAVKDNLEDKLGEIQVRIDEEVRACCMSSCEVHRLFGFLRVVVATTGCSHYRAACF